MAAARKAAAPAKRAPRGRKKAADAVVEAGAVEKAVLADLKELAKLDRGLSTSARAATALAMAREIDNPRNSATSKSMCAKQLRETLDELRALAPDDTNEDRLDDLSARRAQRLARGSTTPDPPRT